MPTEQEQDEIVDQIKGRQLAELTLELIGPELKEKPTRMLVGSFCAWIRKALLQPALDEGPLARKVIDRIGGREIASEVRKMYGPELSTADTAQACVDELADKLLPKAAEAKQEALVPIAQLGTSTLEFGEFKHTHLDDIPRDRLDFYLRKAEENVKLLRAYLNHPELEARRRGNEKLATECANCYGFGKLGDTDFNCPVCGGSGHITQ
jgi:hypothetical protein